MKHHPSILVAVLLTALWLCSSPAQPEVAILATQESPLMTEPDAGAESGVKGIVADILDEVLLRRLGIAWKGQFLPWARAQLQVKNGQADMLITIPTDERREYSLASDQPVLLQYLHVYTYRGHPRIEAIRAISSIADIKQQGLLPLSNAGNGWFKQHIDTAGIAAYYAPADQNIAEMLAARRGDLMIDLPLSMNPTIKALGIGEQLEMTDARFGPIGFHLLISQKSPLVARIAEINRAIEAFIADGSREVLLENYLKDRLSF